MVRWVRPGENRKCRDECRMSVGHVRRCPGLEHYTAQVYCVLHKCIVYCTSVLCNVRISIVVNCYAIFGPFCASSACMWVYCGCVPWTEYVWWVMRYPNIYVAWFALCSDPRKWLVKGARYRLNWSVVANEDVHVLIVWLLRTGHVWCFLDSSWTLPHMY